jgi:hypothetical protein
MEPISIDTIEQADFFVWHLDENQFEEWKANYAVKQEFLTRIFSNKEVFNLSNVQSEFILRNYLVIFISFNYYGIDFPDFERDTYMEAAHKKRELFEKGGKYPTNYRRLQILIKETKQTFLSKYLVDKFNETKDGKSLLFTNGKPTPLMNLLLLVDFLQEEVEKMEATGL